MWIDSAWNSGKDLQAEKIKKWLKMNLFQERDLLEHISCLLKEYV